VSWIAILPAAVMAVLLLYVPGAVIAACLKFRLGAILGLAPLHSTAAAGLAGVIGGMVGVPWSILPFLLVSALLAAVALAITRGIPWRMTGAPPLRQWLPFAAIALATVPITWRFVQLVGSPGHPSQVFDNVFHLNAIRFILDTGNASSLSLASIQGVSGLDAVYPAAWHSFAALLVQLTAVDIPTAQNALNLVVAAVIWPASCLFLVTKTVSRRPAALVIAAVIAATQVAFPFLMIVWGPLFPYALAISMMPAVITTLAALARLGRTRTDPLRSWVASLMLALGGLAFAHTSSINTTLAVSFPIVGLLWWRLAKRAEIRRNAIRAWLFIAATLVMFVIAAGFWFKLRPAPYDNWGPSVKPGAAVGEILTVSTMQSAIPAVVVSVLSVVGLLTVFRMRKLRWIAVCYGVVGALYVVAASFPKGAIRDALVGTWYQDTYRLAALLPLFATPLAVIGGIRLWDSWRTSCYALRLQEVLERRGSWLRSRSQPAVAAVTALAFAVIATVAGPLTHYIGGASTTYRFDGSSELLTPDEMALLKRVPNHVPPDAVIADNPWNGSSLAYAYTGRRVLTAHLFAEKDTDASLIDQSLKEATERTAVCTAVKNKNVQFVLDFGSRYLIDLPGSENYPGVTDIGQSPGFTLVDSQGDDARLYRISACG
jgi:hypothetical protein